MLLVSSVFLWGSPSPQVSYDLQQFDQVHVDWTEAFFFSLCLVSRNWDLWVLSSLIREWERLSPIWCRNLIILGTSKREKSRGGAWWPAFGMAFLAWRGVLGIQSATPSEELHHSQFGGAFMTNPPDFFDKQINLALAVFGGGACGFITVLRFSGC